MDECDNIKDAYNQGYDIIEHLKTASLFESVRDNGWVKMHDVIRDVALWLSTIYSGNNNKIVVEENDIVEATKFPGGKRRKRYSFEVKV